MAEEGEVLDTSSGEGFEPGIDVGVAEKMASEMAVGDGSAVDGEDPVDGAVAPGLLEARRPGRAGSFVAVEGIAVKVEGSSGPEAAPAGGKDAGPGGVFYREEGEDGGEEVFREEAD